MKISIQTPAAKRKRQEGLATILMLILLALVLSFIIANASTLSTLHYDVKRIEQRQIRRINPAAATTSTNSPAPQAISK
jgi:hypothetical protein